MDKKQSSDKRFALLIDADNVSAKYLSGILDELSKYGTATYKRIYGDWTSPLHAKWKEALLENSIIPIQQFSYTQGKNATDSAMIIDAMDILYTNSVDGFCLVSSDSDFTRLAARIRESGLMVIGMGEKKTPVPFRKTCDIFTTLELLDSDDEDKTEKGKNGAPSLSKKQVERAVISIVTDNQNKGKATALSAIGNRLQARYPDFDVRNYGTNQLIKLLGEFSGVVVDRSGKSITVELAEPKTQPKKAKPEKPEQASTEKAAAEKTSNATKQKPKSTVKSRAEGAADTKSADTAKSKAEGAADTKPADTAKSKSGDVPEAQTKAKPKAKGKSKKPAAQPKTSNAPAADSPESYIRALLAEAGSEGMLLPTLGQRVRNKFRTFKLRDLGYSKFKDYVADLEGIEIVQKGNATSARLA